MGGVSDSVLVESTTVSDSFEETWEELKPAAGRFPPAAFEFVLAGLSHTVRSVHGAAVAEQMASGEADPDDESRHVSGRQLCLGLRDYALQRYGRLARTVLGRWNINETDDFGRIVFAMIEAKQLRKTEQDRFEDFQGVFQFDDAFGDLTVSR
jgi:uncharacterized repeat protein (TIGR04138 family)